MIAPPSREKIFKEIINYIDYNKSPYIHIFAGSKMGKTTILYNLKEYFLTQKHLIVVYYRFGSENLLPFNEWLNSIINNKFENYKAHIDSENPSYRFIQILKKLKDPNFVDSTINVIFLLDDLHKINRLPDFSSYYNFFGRLSDDSSINNFKIIATTVRNYSERNHGGSLFFLKCNYTTTLYPFTKEDLRILFNDVSDNLIDIIKRKTGGHPQLVFQLLNLIGTNSDNEIYDLSQDNIWENLSQLINLETYLRSLNEEEIELLLIIVDKLDFNNSVSISKINSTQINNKILKRNINNLKNSGLIEEESDTVSIVGDIFTNKIRKEYMPVSDIYQIIKDDTKTEKKFHQMAVSPENNILFWILDDINKNRVAFLDNISNISTQLGKEISSLANTESGIICFGVDNKGTFKKIDEDVFLKEVQNITTEFKIKPNIIMSWFYFNGLKINCLLVKKMSQNIYFKNEYYLKIDGMATIYSKSIEFSLNPDFHSSTNEGYLFLPSLYKFQQKEAKILQRQVKDITSTELASMSELIDNKKLHDIKNDNIESILMKLNEKYANLWNGAIQSKFSDNPDKIRHYCISIRELFTHIINDLAPDDKIKEWTQDPKLYNNNAPTKKARILYIFRELNNDQFLSSIEENINFFLNIIEILNKGTHELFSSFNDEKIVFIEIKIEYLLRIIANLEFIKYKVKS